MQATSPAYIRKTAPPSQYPQEATSQANPDSTYYEWDALRGEQQQAAWQMVENMRSVVARDRARRRYMELLILLGVIIVVASAVGVYLLVHT